MVCTSLLGELAIRLLASGPDIGLNDDVIGSVASEPFFRPG